MWNILLSCFTLFSLLTCKSGEKVDFSNIKGNKETVEFVSDTCLYDKGTHAAFTSLEEWNGDLYLAFREGDAHRATETDKGKIRVLKKTNKGWIIHHTFELEGTDLRDPYFIKWNNQLYLYTLSLYSRLTKDGWTKLENIHHNAPHYLWIWKMRPYKNELYGVGYANNKWPILLKSADGVEWKVVTTFKIGGCASEADMIFIKDKMYICLRIDQPIGSNSMWGSSKYPFTEFEWSMMPTSISSPEMIYLPHRKLMLLAGREYYINKLTGKLSKDVSLCSMTLEGNTSGKIKIDSDSSGDKGYPSFCYYDGKLYMSYYVGDSSHSSIRLSTFEIK